MIIIFITDNSYFYIPGISCITSLHDVQFPDDPFYLHDNMCMY